MSKTVFQETISSTLRFVEIYSSPESFVQLDNDTNEDPEKVDSQQR